MPCHVNSERKIFIYIYDKPNFKLKDGFKIHEFEKPYTRPIKFYHHHRLAIFG